MHVRLLGSAAGGRFPQWNCGCGNCAAVRERRLRGKSRTQSQLALSADGTTWFLIGASPDLASQIEATAALHPRARRDSPIAGVVLANADLDHVLGLLLLRELQPFRVYAAPSILRILREENSMFGMLNRVEPQVVWTAMQIGASFFMLSAAGSEFGIACEAHPLSGRYPKYVKSTGLAPGEATAGLFFTSQTGSRLAYLPAVGKLDDALMKKIDGLDLLLFDGTFWSDDELVRVEAGSKTAHQMGHIPVEESLVLLKNVKAARRLLVHINNTNPILNEDSPEHRAVCDAGWEIAEDNWHLKL